MEKILLLMLILMSGTAMGQSLSVFEIDTTSFPTIKAKFYAFDASGNQIKNLTSDDFLLKEDGMKREVILTNCPPEKVPIALSSVLVFDISGSMQYGPPRIESAKRAATSWVNALPVGQSECALVTFDHRSQVLQDFTKDKAVLINKVSELKPEGGTDYNQALINLPCGGLQIAKSGKNKRIVILLTDGMPENEPRTQEIIDFAKLNQIVIYAVTLDMPAPKSLKEITKQTGGFCFENITSQKEAENTYLMLLKMATDNPPCDIAWESGTNCSTNYTLVDVNVPSKGISDKTAYWSPNRAISKLEFTPANANFRGVTPGVQKEITVNVSAVNANFNVTNITLTNKAFTISPTSFSLNKGESRTLTLKYLPLDSSYNNCKIIFENLTCQTKYYARGGFPGKEPSSRTIQLIKPNGGEEFISGSDELITWDGVSPEEKVTIEYRLSETSPWIKLSESASGLSYNFKVPNVESNTCLARVTSNLGVEKSEDMVLIPSGTFMMGNTGQFSSDNWERPIHQVTLTQDFMMSKYEVTQKQYKEIMGINYNHSRYKGDSLPVENVTLIEAMEFCNALSKKEDLEECYSFVEDPNEAGKVLSVVCNWDANGYRLPTEAEWEYACKAGTKTDYYNGNIVPGSTKDPMLDKIAWFNQNSDNTTHIVGHREANAFGLYDMLGNVSEWCWGALTPYQDYPVINPRNELMDITLIMQIYRGGSIYDDVSKCRSSDRVYPNPDNKFCFGFRIVKIF